VLAGDTAGIQKIHLATGVEDFVIQPDWQQDPKLFAAAKKQFAEYFTGRRQQFDLSIQPVGTDFQQRVWEELQKIPYGQTRSYGQIASKIGKPKAARAVGQAVNRNPLPLVIPCHRVIGSSGQLVGFAPGIELKNKLLELEK